MALKQYFLPFIISLQAQFLIIAKNHSLFCEILDKLNDYVFKSHISFFVGLLSNDPIFHNEKIHDSFSNLMTNKV